MLNKIIADCAQRLNVDAAMAEKLIRFIDICKMRGLTGGETASRFGDYLGFHQLPDDPASHELFASRWTDHKVWIPITDEIRRYLNNETPLFTQSRLEPVYQKKPFYEQGNTVIETGANRNPEDNGPVRKPKDLEEAYSNFIIHEYLPEHFCLEVFKDQIPGILKNGLPAVDAMNAYRVYVKPEEARQSLSRDLLAKGMSAARAVMLEYTLLELQVDKMQMDNTVFYTKTISGHRGQGSNYGYFYVADVPADGIKVSTHNIAK